MALNKIYTDNTVVKRNNSSGGIAWVATKPYKELFGEGEFDLSILLNNSSTSKMLNNGAYGDNPTKYNSENVVASGEPTTPIQFLGCFLSTNDSYSLIYGINVTQKMSMTMDDYGGDSWQQFIDNFRFIVDFVPADGVSYQEYQDFDYYNTTKIKYGLSSSYLTFSALYNTSNVQLYNRNQTSNPESITGDDAKRFLRSGISVTTTNYNKYMSDTTKLSKENLTTLWYAFRVNGDLIIIREPVYLAPASDYNKVYFKIDSNTRKYLTIGGFSDSVADGTTGGLPTDDNSKGLYVGKFSVSGQFKQCNFYYSTNNAIMHNANSTGIRWTVNNINSADDFRKYVRLGVMDSNGLITHNEWIQGETGIANSDNPNKDGSYSDLPDWKPSDGGDKDEIEPMLYGDNVGLYGAVTYYTMTYVQLSSFMDALKAATIEHPDIASGFVSAYYIPKVLDNITHSTEMPVRVKGVELSGATGGKTILQKSLVLGTIYVPVRHNNAFDTLTKYFLYTPYTDVIPLNYKCYGKTLTIIMLPALQDCTASIIVQCDGMTIAKQTVSLGSSLAIAVENNSEKSTAIVNACSKYLASAGGVIGGAVTGNLPAVAGGAIGVVAATVNVLNAIGNTYIHSYGTTTGTSLSLNPQNIYLIEYIVKPDKPDNFASTVGNLCNKELTLTENMGYTVCDNPKIYGTMTLAERTEIENYLRSGVIL